MDRREARSRHRLRNAILDLLRETEFDQIRIIDITEQADTAISTFYRLYANKLDLLKDSLAMLMEQVEEFQIGEPFTFQNTLDLNIAPPLVIALKIIDQDRVLYRRILQTPYRPQIFQLITHLAEQKIRKDTPEWKPHEVHLFVPSLVGFCIYWLENDLDYTPEQAAMMIHWMTVCGVMALRGEIDRVTIPSSELIDKTLFTKYSDDLTK